MSTKIYEGLKFNSLDINLFYNFINKLKQDILDIQRKTYIELEKKLYNDFKNIKTIEELNKYNSLYSLNIKDIALKDINFLEYEILNVFLSFMNVQERGAIYDTDAYLCFKPLEKYILLLPFLGSAYTHKIFFSNEYIQDYGYWNNSDMPEDFSLQEWNQRKEDWKFLNIPSIDMVTIQLHQTSSWLFSKHNPEMKEYII